MKKTTMRTTTGALLAFALLWLVASCAEQRPAINRVQATALEKAFFVGPNLRDTADDPEFYMRGVVVDVGYGAAQDGLFTSTWAQPVSRIRWEITEHRLNARLAYERIQGTDGKGNAMNGLKKKASNDGQIVASYHITSHFDIKRAYNSTTGEAYNVVEENSSDRPWYERQYMRVDWSENMATDTYDFDTLSMMGIYGGISYESIPYAITDENHPDAPHFDLGKSYFDVTVKAFAKPMTIDLSSLGWGIDSFPACWLPAEFAGGTAPYGNCNPVELTLRYSFRKVVDTDYEPMDWDGFRFQAHGLFTQDYYGYDRRYGMVDNKWWRFASRYNIWERSHFYADPAAMTGEFACATQATTVTPTGNPAADPNRDVNPRNGTADECEQVTAATGIAGSRCDAFKGKCTLPMRARRLKTIPWYINGSTEEDLFEATNWAVQEWDVAMRAAVQTGRLVECRRTGGGNGCDEAHPMWSGQQDDYDDAVQVARNLDACNRRTSWSDECKAGVDADVEKLAAERGKAAATDANLKAIAAVMKSQPVIVLCHNPVIESDHPTCGARGLAPRQGDLRYHTVLNIDKPQTPSAWGIMVDADDPITGEKLAASINIWTHITDLATQGLADLVRYMNGELTTDQITNGSYVFDWVEAEKISGGTVAALPTLTRDDVAKRLAAATKLDPAAFSRAAEAQLSPEIRTQLQAVKQQALDVAAHADVPSPMQAAIDARLNMARGTPTEAKLINAPMLQLAGVPGSLPVTGTVKQVASPLQLNNPRLLSQLRNARENALAKRGACIVHEAPEASALTGIADAMKKKFPAALGESPEEARTRTERMIRYLRRRYHYAVIAHEMGHSIGLRHNFVSSYGALHYRPQYWQLRTKNGAVTTECTDAVSDGATCVGPRYYDPVTAEEQNQLIWMFMQSSVMDYPGDVSQDMIGLGIWDFASARMAYGDTVAVYKNPDIAAGSRIGVGITGATDTFGGLLGIKYSVAGIFGPEDFHYSQLQKEYGLISDCYRITAAAPSWWREDVDGKWDAALDGKVVAVDGVYKKCRQMPVDYAAWNDLRVPTQAEKGGGYYRGGPSVAPGLKLRVPYHFATDHWADTGNVSAFRHDNGADPYEQAMFLITTQENRHIFDNFRRNRTTFSVRGAADRSFGRYNEKLVNISGGIAFLGNIYKNFAAAAGYTWDTLWPTILNREAKEQVLAASIAFDHLTRQLSRPEDGPHFARASSFADPVLRSAKDPDGPEGRSVVTVPNGTTGYLRDVGIGGRPIENKLSDEHGDYDTRYTENAGSYYDKINSIFHMSISEDRFISQSRGDFVDARARANGMADIFPDGWRRVIANSLTGDKQALAPFVAADQGSRPLADLNGFPTQPIGWTSWWPTDGPEICFASGGRNACTAVDGSTLNLHPSQPAKMVPLDPEIGWEVQKFIIVWSLGLVLANEHAQWKDMMALYKLGDNADPGIANRIEWQDPVSGQVYYARTYGKECLFGAGPTCTGGKVVQKGIAARVVEWANTLTARAYKLDTTRFPARPGFLAGHNDFGRPMIVRHPDGTPVIVSDPAMRQITGAGGIGTPKPDCDQNVTATCEQLSKWDNRWAIELEGYKSVPDFMWEVGQVFGIANPHQLGLYP